jgi:hypothetical protein
MKIKTIKLLKCKNDYNHTYDWIEVYKLSEYGTMWEPVPITGNDITTIKGRIERMFSDNIINYIIE